jgi:polysaccharide transporter, PST family
MTRGTVFALAHRWGAKDHEMTRSLEKGVPSSIIHLITQHSGLHKIIANTGWLFVDQVASLMVGFLVGAWVARYLGPARYGIYNYALAIVALLTPLVALGLKDIVIRDIVRAPDDKDEILGTVFGLQLVGGLFALALSIGIAQVTRSENPLAGWLIVVLAGQFIFQAFSVTLVYWFNSQVQAKYIVWANNIALFFFCLVRIGLVLSEAPLIAFAWAALGQAFAFAIAVAAFHRLSRQSLFTWQVSFTRARRLLGNSWPLLVSALAIMLYMKIGQVMLGNMIGAKELGIYSAAARLTDLWNFIPMAIAASVFPAVVRSHENDSDEVIRKRMQLFYDVMAGIAYTIVIPLILLAPLLVEIVFGPSYAEAASILRIQAWALPFVFLGVARSRWIIAEDMVRFNMLATILGALTCIVMNLILIPKFSGLGAALAVVVSQAVSTYLSSILSKRLWPVFGQQSLSLLVPFRFFSLRSALKEVF